MNLLNYVFYFFYNYWRVYLIKSGDVYYRRFGVLCVVTRNSFGQNFELVKAVGLANACNPYVEVLFAAHVGGDAVVEQYGLFSSHDILTYYGSDLVGVVGHPCSCTLDAGDGALPCFFDLHSGRRRAVFGCKPFERRRGGDGCYEHEQKNCYERNTFFIEHGCAP